MRAMTAVLLTLVLSGCASGGSGPRSVSAVVQDESARQAAAVSAQHGDGSEAALGKGLDAASTETSKTEPPT